MDSLDGRIVMRKMRRTNRYIQTDRQINKVDKNRIKSFLPVSSRNRGQFLHRKKMRISHRPEKDLKRETCET